MPRPKVSAWNQDNRNAQQLAMAKKAAAKAAPPKESWWMKPDGPSISREEFYSRAAHRHRQILNAASDGTRSLNKVT